MVSYTVTDLERHLMLYEEEFGLDFDGQKIGDCIKIIQEKCPRLHSVTEIREYALRNLKSIEQEYGYKALRIFYWSYIKQDLLKSFTGEDMLEQKYYKLIKDIKKYHMNELLEWIDLQLDYYLYQKELENVYIEEYGLFKDYNNQLYSIMKTIHLSRYDEKVIDTLHPYLKNACVISDAKYYLKQDLKDKEVLDMLYEHITEENFDNSQYDAIDNIFVDFDGYGNEYYRHDYSESWTDTDGVYHYRSWEKPTSIDDYIRKG